MNFRRPYLASSITDFWRRWHISLSTWLRDYLYIPLGGNRHGQWMTYRNLAITMLLGGLWHGASWNFVIWGGYHGALLSVERVFRGDRPMREEWTWLYPVKAIADVWPGADQLGLLSGGRSAAEHAGSGPDVLPRPEATRCFSIGTWGWLWWRWSWRWWKRSSNWFERIVEAPAWAYATALAAMFFCLEVFGVIDASIPFIYFQF